MRTWLAFLFSSRIVHVRWRGHTIAVRCNTPDPTVFERIFITDEYGAVADLQSCRSILDCGAYAGFSTVYFATRFPTAKIVAVEPDASNLEMLRLNTAACANVVVVHGAVWSHRCGLRIENEGDEPWSFRVMEGGPIPATTIANLARDHDLRPIDLLKIDIEGSERQVFESGYESWLRSVRLLLIELHDHQRPGSSDTFYEAVGDHFRLTWSGENVIAAPKMRGGKSTGWT